MTYYKVHAHKTKFTESIMVMKTNHQANLRLFFCVHGMRYSG